MLATTRPAGGIEISSHAMKAVRMHRYGDATVLQFESAPRPEPQPDEVLVRVHAAGVNPADWQFRSGWYRDRAPLPLPFILGMDVSGTVVSVGDAVSRFGPGDPVIAMTDSRRQGTYAQYVTVLERAAAPAPRRLTFTEAAGIPLAALTAWSALFDVGGLESGQRVLVHAGAGGVGMFAVQLARCAGAEVISTASSENRDTILGLGAHDVIDYRTEDVVSRVSGVDLVLDTVGGDTRDQSWQLLRPGGTMVAVAMPPTNVTDDGRMGVRAATVGVAPDGKRLSEISRMIDASRLRVLIDREYALADAADAHRHSEGRHARGKIVLRVPSTTTEPPTDSHPAPRWRDT